MKTQPEALRLADALQQQAVWEGHYGPSYLRDLLPEAAAELRRLQAQRDALLEAYRKMKNVAAGYSNLCDGSAFTRKLEREFEAVDAIARAAIKAVEETK